MDELINISATKLALAIRNKHVSSVEVVKAYLERIEAVNPRINAVVQLRAEAALEEAQAYDQALARDEIKGPLHGVPFTVKDSLETAGLISTAGTLGRANFVPEQDAVSVARMKAAGGIVLGKTNLPEVLMGIESDNLVYGRTNNPYDFSRTCGGSSGGEAAIQAAGASPLGLGSDSGGSVRIPAHFCGVAGIKPTTGRVARTGQFPPYGGLMDRMSQIGILSRWVEDLILALPLISGPDWRDQSVVAMPLGDPSQIDLKTLRVAFYTDNGIISPTLETAQVIKNAAQVLNELGAKVEENRPAGIEQSFDITMKLMNPDGGVRVRAALKRLGTPTISSLVEKFMSFGSPLSTSELLDLMSRWDVFRGTMLAFLENYDVIICPVAAYPAMEHGTTLDEDKAPSFSYAMTYNLTGWPGVVVRGGTSSEGLPIGVQVIARPFREDVALAVARQLETTLGGWQPSPLL